MGYPRGAITFGAILIDRAQLLRLPTAGAAWQRLANVADRNWGPVDLADQDNRTNLEVLDGALVEDVSRGPKFPHARGLGIRYSLEALHGAVFQALLLERAGYGDIWETADRALLRAAQFLDDKNTWPGEYAVDYHFTWVLNYKYGENSQLERPRWGAYLVSTKQWRIHGVTSTSALPKRWINVTASVRAVVREKLGFLIKRVAMQR